MGTSKRPKRDVPGNAMESARQMELWYARVGSAVATIEALMHEPTEMRPCIEEIRIVCNVDDPRGVLLVVKGFTPLEPVVAFHADETLTDALRGLGNRLRNSSLKWKVDQYAAGDNRTD